MTDRPSHPHELISAMLDGEIDERERAVVEAHLRECAECRDLAGDLTALGEVLADEPVPPVPAGLAERIGWRLRSRDASRRRLGAMSWSGPRTLAALGGVAAAAVLAVLVVREGSAPFLERSPARTDQRAAANDMKPSAEKDEAQEKLRSLGYMEAEGTSGAYGNRDNYRDNHGAARSDASRQQPGRRAGPGSGSASGGGVGNGASPGSGSETSAKKGDFLGYAPAPNTVPSEPRGEPSAAQTAPAPPAAPSMGMRAQEHDLPKLEAGVASSTMAPAAEAPSLQERAKRATTVKAPTVSAEEEKTARLRDLDRQREASGAKDVAAGGTTPAGSDARVGKEGVAGATTAEDAVAPPPAAPEMPPAPDRRAARGEASAPSQTKSKTIDNESLSKQTIPACPGDSGDKPLKRWTATSAPLPLRVALSEAEPDLAALAARLGGSICEERPSGASPIIVLDVPVGRWSELLAALATRAEPAGTLTPPPAEGFGVVRVVLRPR